MRKGERSGSRSKYGPGGVKYFAGGGMGPEIGTSLRTISFALDDVQSKV